MWILATFCLYYPVLELVTPEYVVKGFSRPFSWLYSSICKSRVSYIVHQLVALRRLDVTIWYAISCFLYTRLSEISANCRVYLKLQLANTTRLTELENSRRGHQGRDLQNTSKHDKWFIPTQRLFPADVISALGTSLRWPRDGLAVSRRGGLFFRTNGTEIFSWSLRKFD